MLVVTVGSRIVWVERLIISDDKMIEMIYVFFI